jgi:hypothetical protein
VAPRHQGARWNPPIDTRPLPAGAIKHLISRLGRTKLTPREVQRFLTGLKGRLAPAGVIKVHAVLRVALSDAEGMDLVPRNVAT